MVAAFVREAEICLVQELITGRRKSGRGAVNDVDPANASDTILILIWHAHSQISKTIAIEIALRGSAPGADRIAAFMQAISVSRRCERLIAGIRRIVSSVLVGGSCVANSWRTELPREPGEK